MEFVNGSDRSGTPVLIRWRPSGQLINPDEAAEQVYYLVESKDRPGELDVLQHEEFIKLLPDDLRESEQQVRIIKALPSVSVPSENPSMMDSSDDVESAQPSTERSLVGQFYVHQKFGAVSTDVSMEFRSDGTFWSNKDRIGTWSAADDGFELQFDASPDRKAMLRFGDRHHFRGEVAIPNQDDAGELIGVRQSQLLVGQFQVEAPAKANTDAVGMSIVFRTNGTFRNGESQKRLGAWSFVVGALQLRFDDPKSGTINFRMTSGSSFEGQLSHADPASDSTWKLHRAD